MLTEEQAKVKYLKYKQKYLQLKANLENEQIGGSMPPPPPNPSEYIPSGNQSAVPSVGNPVVDFFMTPLGIAVATSAAFLAYEGVKKATNWLFVGSTSESPEQIANDLVKGPLPQREESEQFFDAVENAVDNESDPTMKANLKTKFNNLLSSIFLRRKLALPPSSSAFVTAATRRLDPALIAALENKPAIENKILAGNSQLALANLIQVLNSPSAPDFTQRSNQALSAYIQSVGPNGDFKALIMQIFKKIESPNPTSSKYMNDIINNM